MSVLMLVALLTNADGGEARVVGSVQLGVGARPGLRDLTLYTAQPTIASFDLRADQLDTSFMRAKVVLSGYGQLDGGELALRAPWPYSGVADLNLAFAEGRFVDDRLVVRVGRQFVLNGGARMLRLDGAVVDARVVAGLGISAWAGAVATLAFIEKPRADFATGARAYYRFGTDHELGVSFTALRDGPGWARQDIGVDARGRPLRWLTLSGYALWALGANRLADLDARATFQPTDMVSAVAAYRRSSPDLFISQMSIFSVFAEQSRDEAGGEVGVYPHARLHLDGAAYWLHTPSGTGYRANGRVSGRLGSRMQTHVGVEAGGMRAPTAIAANDGYAHVRGFIRVEPAEGWQVAADVANYFLSRRVNGHANSFSATLVVGYQPTPAWWLNVSASAGENPYFARYIEAMARVTYRFSSGQKP